MTATRSIVLLAVGIALTGCAGDRVLLLENEAGGSAGAVALLHESGEAELIDHPNESARISRGRFAHRRMTSSDEIDSRYGDVISHLPKPPAVFVLYFYEGTTNLVPQSEPVLEALLDEVARRPGADIQVTGHTDRLGTSADNDRLSHARAREISNYLVKRGLDRDVLTIAGRGERDPLVLTDDEVVEPRNRRVEVTVR